MKFNEEALFARYPFRNEHGLFVDVGANNGSFLEEFAKRDWRIIAYEPHPELFRALVARWGEYPRVTCVQKAIAEAPSTLPFYTSAEHPGIHSLAPFHPTHVQTTVVEVVSLTDELNAAEIPDVTALKIDVEGADFLALRGFDFSRWSPELVMVEFMDSRSQAHFGYSHHDMASYMHRHGYVTFVSEWAPLVEYGRDDEESPHRWLSLYEYDATRDPAHGNLLFVRPQDRTRLKRVARSVAYRLSARSTIRAIPGARQMARALHIR